GRPHGRCGARSSSQTLGPARPRPVARREDARCAGGYRPSLLVEVWVALRVPLYDLVSTWAYMVIATLAWSLRSWFALMLTRKSERTEYVTLEFRRFLPSMILFPCRVVRQAHGITLRVLGYQPTLD